MPAPGPPPARPSPAPASSAASVAAAVPPSPRPVTPSAPLLNPDLRRLRPRPDFGPTAADPAQGWAAALGATFADIIGLAAIGPGQLLLALDATSPVLMAWSRSATPGALPPARLAAAILARLPELLAITLAEFLADTPTPGKDDAAAVLTRPRLEILSPAGVPLGLAIAFHARVGASDGPGEAHRLTVSLALASTPDTDEKSAVVLRERTVDAQDCRASKR